MVKAKANHQLNCSGKYPAQTPMMGIAYIIGVSQQVLPIVLVGQDQPDDDDDGKQGHCGDCCNEGAQGSEALIIEAAVPQKHDRSQ